MTIPPTKNHHQLAKWVNDTQLVDNEGRIVIARVEKSWSSTDSKLAGTRLRRAGKGRKGLKLVLRLRDAPPAKPNHWRHDHGVVFSHDSSETYRCHAEARQWIISNLWRESDWKRSKRKSS